jgi:hypothetical protein
MGFRRVIVSSRKNQFTRPLSVRYCCLEMNINPRNCPASRRRRKSLFETPNTKAFKLKYIVESLVTSGRCQKTELSKELSSSHSNLPNRYRTSVDRFPCENTIHRRKIPVSLFILFTIGKEINGPRKEVNTSDGLDTVMKLEDSIKVYLDPGG